MATSTVIQKQNGPLIRQAKMTENRTFDYVYGKYRVIIFNVLNLILIYN